MTVDDGESVMDEDMSSAVSLLMERLLEQECAEMDHPHVVICRVPGTNVISYQGPYATGLDAVVAADREAAIEAATGSDVEFSVAPLHPSGGQEEVHHGT